MAFWPLRLALKCIRIFVGLVLVAWSVVSFVIFILPGGLWTLFIGLAILAIDIPAVRRFNEWLRAKIREKFPRFYQKVIVPLDAAKDRGTKKMKAWFERLRNGFWPKLILGALVVLLAGASPALALEIENAEKIPYQLDTKFIEGIWKKVIQVTNDEAFILRVPEDAKMPPVVYVDPQPKGSEASLAGIRYEYYEATGEVVLATPRVIRLYKRAFRESMPGLPYGSIAQEFFHEALIYQHVSMDWQHCTMLNRKTLVKVLEFIDAHLGTGRAVTDKILADTEAQCLEELTVLGIKRY